MAGWQGPALLQLEMSRWLIFHYSLLLFKFDLLCLTSEISRQHIFLGNAAYKGQERFFPWPWESVEVSFQFFCYICSFLLDYGNWHHWLQWMPSSVCSWQFRDRGGIFTAYTISLLNKDSPSLNSINSTRCSNNQPASTLYFQDVLVSRTALAILIKF